MSALEEEQFETLHELLRRCYVDCRRSFYGEHGDVYESSLVSVMEALNNLGEVQPTAEIFSRIRRLVTALDVLGEGRHGDSLVDLLRHVRAANVDRVDLLGFAGVRHVRRGNHRRAEDMFVESIEAARASGDRDAIAKAQANLIAYKAKWSILSDESLEEEATSTRPEVQLRLVAARFNLALTRGDIDAMNEAFKEIAAIAQSATTDADAPSEQFSRALAFSLITCFNALTGIQGSQYPGGNLAKVVDVLAQREKTVFGPNGPEGLRSKVTNVIYEFRSSLKNERLEALAAAVDSLRALSTFAFLEFGPESPESVLLACNAAVGDLEVARRRGDLVQLRMASRALEQVARAARTRLGSEHLIAMTATSNAATAAFDIARATRDVGDLQVAEEMLTIGLVGKATYSPLALILRRQLLKCQSIMSGDGEFRGGAGSIAVLAPAAEEPGIDSEFYDAAFVATLIGSDRPAVLSRRDEIAQTYQAIGRLADAVALLEANSADYERLLGPEHPDTLSSRNSLANAYRDLGRHEDAIQIYEANLADRERLLGPEHPDTLSSRNNIAVAYWDGGRLVDAVGLFEVNLADCERLLGPEHPDTLSSRNNLANAYWDFGRYTDAIQIYEANLADRERLLGPEHPDTLSSRNNLAGSYRAIGRYAEAVRLFEANLAMYQQLFGPDHIATVRSREKLSQARSGQPAVPDS
jgi:tetratricopeptide (TPR) repeat protein